MGITIVVPVGPNPAYQKYLEECLDSISVQMADDDELLIIDDRANLELTSLINGMYRIFKTPWNVGCADGWNFGVGLANNEWCILMGSDDVLLEGCLASCREVILNHPDPYGYYNLTCITSEGDVIDLHNNAAMVSKSLWKMTGGFPPEAGAGAPDALLISGLLGNKKEHLQQIRQGTPLYWVRVHKDQDTRRTGLYWNDIISIRDKYTKNFKWEERQWA